MRSADAAAPQAPRTGPLRRVLGRYYFTGDFWYRLHHWAAGALPDALMAPVLGAFTAVFLIVLGDVRRAVGANLELVLGPCGRLERWRRTWRTLHTFAWCLTERYERFRPGTTFDVRYEGLEHWESAAGGGRGVLLATAHVGNWELGSALPGSTQARVVHVVRTAEIDPAAQRFTAELLASCGTDYRTHFVRDDPTFALPLLEGLARGEVVCLQADRPAPGARAAAATLLGVPVELPVGPVALARTAGVPLLPVFTLREGRRRYRVVFRPPVPVPRTRERDADHAAGVRGVAREVERTLREAPHQWFCFAPLAGGRSSGS